MRWLGSCFVLLLFFGATLLVGCSDAAGWQLVDLSEKPEVPAHVHEALPVLVESSRSVQISPDIIEDLQVKMLYQKSRHSGSNRGTYQILVTYHHRDRDRYYVYICEVDFDPEGGSVSGRGGSSTSQRHIRDYDQPVEYMVHQRLSAGLGRIIYNVAVWTNSPEVKQIHIKANNQSFDVEGEGMILLRWEGRTEWDIEQHIELTAMDEEGRVIWQDEL